MTYPKLIAIGQFPPPVHGYSYITLKTVEHFKKVLKVVEYDLVPAEQKTKRRAVGRILACLRAAAGLVKTRWQGATHAYIPCEGGAGLYFTSALTFLARLLGYHIICHHHSYAYIDGPSRLMSFLTFRIFSKTTHVFLSSKMRDDFEKRYGPVPEAVCVSNAAFVTIGPRPVEKTRPLTLGLLSNLTREKGAITLLDLLIQLRGKGIQARAVLAGPVPNDDDRTAILEHPAMVQGFAQYRGPLYGDDKIAFYDDIDVFVFATTYRNEAQPTVLFEALARGVEIAANDRGTISSQLLESSLCVARDGSVLDHFADWLDGRSSSADFDRQAVQNSYKEMHDAATQTLSIFSKNIAA